MNRNTVLKIHRVREHSPTERNSALTTGSERKPQTLLLPALLAGVILAALPAESNPPPPDLGHVIGFIEEPNIKGCISPPPETRSIKVDDRVVFRVATLPDWPAATRATRIVDRLNAFLARGDRHEIHIADVRGDTMVFLAQGPIVTADRVTAWRNCTSPQGLANTWAGNLRAALDRRPQPQPPPPPREPPLITINIKPTLDLGAKLGPWLALIAIGWRAKIAGWSALWTLGFGVVLAVLLTPLFLLLALGGSLQAAAGRQFEINITPSGIVLTTLVIALILVTSRAIALVNETHTPWRWLLNQSMGIPKWDFSKSWASNLTVLGALLGTVFTSLQQSLPKSQAENPPALLAAGGLSLFFGVLVLVAPVVYYACGHTEPRDTTSKDDELQVEGYVWGFFLAGTLTVWAVLGELGTTISLLTMLTKEGLFLPLGSALFAVALAGSIAGVIILAWRSLRWTVLYALEKRSPAGLLFAQSMLYRQRWRFGRTTKNVGNLNPALPEWPLL